MNSISLTELQYLIKSSINIGLPDFYWVCAEIAELKTNYTGHCYLELVEKDSASNSVKAKLHATIWRNYYLKISQKFLADTGRMIGVGSKVLVKGRVDYHELYGISLSIIDIDTAYSLGDMEAQRRAIIKRLKDDGVFDMNRTLQMSPLPQRVAIISSPTAAGYTDFMNHLCGNNRRYRFDTTLFEAVMQGELTESSITSALTRLSEVVENFDVAVIIRGGGSKSDLAWFDNYKIAYYTTQCPIPILTGIGHDKDTSITDMVAWRAFKTPTAVADYLIERVEATDCELDNLSTKIIESSRNIIERKRNMMNMLSLSLGKEIALFYKSSDMTLQLFYNRLRQNCSWLIDKQYTKLSGFEKELEHLSPNNILKRGFTLNYINGKIVKSLTEISLGDTLITRFRDGLAESVVEKID